MGHKYNKRDGTWRMVYRFNDTTTVIRSCPKCNFSQPLNAFSLGMAEFSKCPKCQAKLDLPKKFG